jgi:hypothetical protein
LSAELEAGLKKPEEVMEILDAYDLGGTSRGAAALDGCDHKTVAHWVRQRELAGQAPVVERKRPVMAGEFRAKIEELVARSHDRIRADVAHGKLVALGYEESSRTTGRWVADAKRRWGDSRAAIQDPVDQVFRSGVTEMRPGPDVPDVCCVLRSSCGAQRHHAPAPVDPTEDADHLVGALSVGDVRARQPVSAVG